MPVLRAELLELKLITPSELTCWRELAGRALEPNPYFEPEYVLPLARGLGEIDDVALAVVREQDEWRACLPVRRYVRWHRVPLPSLSVWRGHRLYSLLGTPLIARGDEVRSAGELVRLLVNAPGTFFTGLDWLVESGPVYGALRAGIGANGFRAFVFERFERAFLNRRHEPDYLAETISSKHRRELRRQRRKLAEQLGEPQIVERASESAAADDLIDLEGRSALAASGAVLQARPGHAYFFQRCAVHLPRTGGCRCSL